MTVRLTKEQFMHGMELLAAVHGDDHAVFTNSHITEIWLEFFGKYSNEQFLQMIKCHLSVSHWFPKVPNDIVRLYEESEQGKPPGENWQAFNEQSASALPSSEQFELKGSLEEPKDLSSKQMAENRRRFKLLCKIVFEIKGIDAEDKQSKINYLAKAPLHELEAMAKTCQRAKQLSVKSDIYGNLKVSHNALFEDMWKYFHSGSERYKQVAIDWASNPANGCELVCRDGQVIDIKQVEF